MRLFAALPLSTAAHGRLTRLRLRLSQPHDGLRWSLPEQWHLTLLFLGDLEGEPAAEVQAALVACSGLTADLALTELGLFPAKGILFAAVDATASLLRLQAEVRQVTETCGLECDSRPFHPHITLARSKGKTGLKTLQKLAKPALPEFGAPIRWSADVCQLLRSELSPQGSQYTVVASYPLAGHSTAEA